MAVFIAVVKRDDEVGYTASFPDYPSCAVAAPTIEDVLAKAGEALATHIERLLQTGQKLSGPTAADAIERGDAFLVAAVDVPDDLGIAQVELGIPALALARIDSFARRHGLTRSSLFVEAIDRWAMQESLPRDRRAGGSEGPTLFDFANPLDLRVETVATAVEPAGRPAAAEAAGEGAHVEGSTEDITAELARLLEASAGPQTEEAAKGQDRSAAKPDKAGDGD
jgi:predicted RNase H-like HicB family nuclease